MPPDWDWMTGIKSPPLPSVGLLPPLPLLELLLAFVPPDWELVAEVALGIGACVGFAMVTESWLGSGCFSAGCGCLSGCLFSPCGFFSARCISRAVWPLPFSRASAGVLCSAVVKSMAAPSEQAADVVKSLGSFIDMLLSVPGRGAIRRH